MKKVLVQRTRVGDAKTLTKINTGIYTENMILPSQIPLG